MFDCFGKEMVWCIQLCVICRHIQCFLRSPKSARLRILKYCLGEREDEGLVVNGSSSTWRRGDGDASTCFSPLLVVCFQEKRVPQHCGGVRGEAGQRGCCWQVPVLPPARVWGTEGVEYFCSCSARWEQKAPSFIRPVCPQCFVSLLPIS